jgi:hypothetical protein
VCVICPLLQQRPLLRCVYPTKLPNIVPSFSKSTRGPTPEQGQVCLPFQTDVLWTLLKYFYTGIQVCRMHTSKCLLKYQSSILTPTRQSSYPWGLLTLLIPPLQLAGTIIAMGGHQAGSHKKQKPIWNLPAVSTLSMNLPRVCPPPLVTPKSPTRHDNNGQLLLSQTITNSPPLPKHSPAMTALSVASPTAADSASLAAAQIAPPQLASHKRPMISQLSLDYESGVKQIKWSRLCLDSELLFSFLRAPLVVTLKTQRNGSSPRAALVLNIVST